MKLMTLATVLVVSAAVAGSAAAQVTMQPVPNPPEKMSGMGHHKMGKHHHKMEKTEKKTDMAPMAPKS
jgi:Spy/CpxP family protein refolding chaperone